ncbi:MAG: stage IV sporulation protein A [Acutalibacteraceae bacterium]|nr:stage IV sporulation protein A [Acutalibacteraceae bacterium]
MIKAGIYEDIAERTGGDIYIGVVGPVRSGKSTFIKQFMNNLVIPNITEEFSRERAKDELPQSASGRTIMTTEPKFIPENAVSISIDGKSTLRVRMIDCVGYIVPSSLGYIENEQPRMVRTPWYDEPVPFNMAAEVGTHKVITEHSTVGLVITTDGSISDIPRDEYEEAEERVINELKEINKPFAVILNCMYPESSDSKNLCEKLNEKYNVPVVALNCLELNEEQIGEILYKILKEFPIKELFFDYPEWINKLPLGHWLKDDIITSIKDSCKSVINVKDIDKLTELSENSDYINKVRVDKINYGNGTAVIAMEIARDLFYKVLKELTGIEINNDSALMSNIVSLSKIQNDYARIKNALDEVEATGYGIVMPSIEELKLQEPEIMKQGGRYGVRLRASAPSIHMMKADITTEISPIVGTEKQSEDLIMYLLSEFDEDPIKIWDSNIFGKSLHELVNEGLHTKLSRMPSDARMRLQETLERVINEGCSGLICIIL